MNSNTTILLFALGLCAICSVKGHCGADHLLSSEKKRYDIPCQVHECDYPEISESPLITVRLNFVYFGVLSGVNKTNYEAQIAFFRQAYQQMNITWNITTTIVTDRNQTVSSTQDPNYLDQHLQIARDFYVPNQITFLCTTFNTIQPLISGYAYLPQYVPSDLEDRARWFGLVHLPWAMRPTAPVMTHEIGHMLGLLHTFSASYEGDVCSKCSDNMNSANHDVVGDLCSDTKPISSLVRYCNDPAGNDCNGEWYGNTSLPRDNFMGYTNCPTRFTPQQVARARCYLDRLINFVVQQDDAPVAAPVTTPDVPPTAIQAPVAEPNSNVPVVSSPIESPSSTIEPISTSEPSGVNEPSSPNPVRSPTRSSIVSIGSRMVITTLLGLVCVLAFIL